jgi:glycosyltransferase involved in cell wall biosynthesis
MHVVGVGVVKDDADAICFSVLHHLRIGVDEVWLVDNGSTDGTSRLLEVLARRTGRVVVRADPGPFTQSAFVSGLADEAHRAGADWVVPFDADEFWWPAGGRDLPACLAAVPAGAVSGDAVNYVQARDVMRRRWGAMSGMRWSARPLTRLRVALTGRRRAYVEVPASKCLLRPRERNLVMPGNHTALTSPTSARLDGLVCLHAPLRCRADILRKGGRAPRLDAAGHESSHGWHWRRWHALGGGHVDAEWRANSALDGALHVERLAGSAPAAVGLRPDDRLLTALAAVREEADDVLREVSRTGRLADVEY